MERVGLLDEKTMSETTDPPAIAMALGEHGEVVREVSAAPGPCSPISLLRVVDCAVVCVCGGQVV